MALTKELIDKRYEALRSHAWAANQASAPVRFEVYMEARQFFDDLQREKNVPGSEMGADIEYLDQSSKRTRDLLRVIGYRPKDVEGFKVVDLLPRDPAFFERHLKELTQALDEQKDPQELGERVRALAGEYVSAEKTWPARQVKDSKHVYKTLTGTINTRVENALNFGYASDFSVKFDLLTAEAVLEEMRPVFATWPDGHQFVEYMENKADPRHSHWYVNLNGKEGHSRRLSICQNPTDAMGEVKPVRLSTPRIHCEVIEDQFEGSAAYREACLRELVSFVRSDDFRKKTGYSVVALMGVEPSISDPFLEQMGIKKLQRLRAKSTKWRQPLGVHLTNPKGYVDLDSGSSLAPKGDLRSLLMQWGINGEGPKRFS